MASSLFLLLDDLASMLDDVAAMTKVAASKTAGVLGDDLALNAEQVAGVVAERELPVVWAVAKGSLVNKAILVPAALAISAFAPWGITPLLMVGGAFLCYEGVEKLAHKFLHRGHEEGTVPAVAARSADPATGSAAGTTAVPAEFEKNVLRAVAANPAIDMVAFEREKIKGAIRTDFILSAEIIVISLGTVAGVSLLQQVSVLVLIALVMTIGVYGLVAGIVKLDDLGYYLRKRASSFARSSGNGILWFAPFLMKALSNLGMLAMFLVGGGILVHGVPALAHVAHDLAERGGVSGALLPMGMNLVVGLIAGSIVLAVVEGIKKLRK